MRSLVAAFVVGLPAAAFAAEPDGCDKFKWPIERDRAALTAPDRVSAPSGSTQASHAKAMTVSLQPLDQAALPMPPEKLRGAGNLAGFLKMDAPDKAGSYTASIAGAIWIDVIQDGKFLKPTAFSGATGCDGIRKTMRFDLAAQPYVLQISGSAEPSVTLLIRPSD